MGVDRAAAETELERFADAEDGFWAFEPRFFRETARQGSDPFNS